MTERRTVVQGGRAKAYRPMPLAARRRALAQGIDAYDRGDFFLAHELLEPAWMGTDEPGERDVLQGLIKLSAAFVHAARGNPVGMAKNLRGARDRLITPEAVAAGPGLGIAVGEVVDGIGERLVQLEREIAEPSDWGPDGPELLAIRIPRRPSGSQTPGRDGPA